MMHVSQRATYQIEVYKGYELLASGTVDECAKELGVGRETIKFYLTPAYQRRLAKRKTLDNSRTAIKIDDDGDEL